MAAIIVEENPEWFSITDKREIKRRLYDITRPRREPKRLPPIRWSAEDLDYIMLNYGIIKTRFLSNVINKSVQAIRMKFHAVATPERKAQLPKKYLTWHQNFTNLKNRK